MDLKIKKLFAREFLQLISCIVIAIITYISIFPYNYFKLEQIAPLVSDSLKEYKAWVKYENESIDKQLNEYDIRRSQIKDKATLKCFDTYPGRPHLNHYNFNQITDSIRITEYYISEKTVNKDSQMKISRLSFIISLCGLFLFRYFIYATIWSIKTLKN
jgi:hypothetical protein